MTITKKEYDYVVHCARFWVTVDKIMQQLTQDELNILYARFESRMTYKEVAKKLSMSEEKIRIAEVRILERLKNSLLPPIFPFSEPPS